MPRDPQTASPQRNFTLTTAERVGAMVTGAPAWARRRKRIEDLSAQIVDDHREGRGREVKKKLAELVKLVEQHNMYYPIEANLPLDPDTSCLMELGQPWKPMPRPTLESLLAAAEPKPAPPSLAWSDAQGALTVVFEAAREDGVETRFTLRLDDEALTCTAKACETVRVKAADIEEITGARFLEVVTLDAETIRFPFVLEEALTATLATELTARLRAMRAATADYRGAR